MDGNLVRVAIDYRLGEIRAGDDQNMDDGDAATGRLGSLSYQIGVRYWYSSGTMRYRLHNLADTRLNSRLSYTDLDAHSGEVFGRVDHPWGLFLKFVAGTGAVVEGALADEDFPQNSPYSRTESAQRNGALSYATADLGYSVSTENGLAVAPFVGFAYYHEQLDAYGCAQIAANSGVCSGVSPSTLTISEDADWNAVRVGLAGQWKTPWRGLEIALEGAWAPYGALNANDDHWLRINTPSSSSLAGPIVQTGLARGMQLETTLTGPLTESIDIGIGARYWYLYSHGSQISTASDGIIVVTPHPPPIVPVLPSRRGGTSIQETDFSTRRAGALVQLSAQF